MSTGQMVGRVTAYNLADQARFASVVYANDYGVVGDGTDETTDMQTAINAAVGKTLVLQKPVSYYSFTSLDVPGSITIEGSGYSGVEVRAPTGTTAPMFDLDGVSKVIVAGINFTVAGAPSGLGASHPYAVWVRGASTDVVISNCTMIGYRRGVDIDGSAGTVAGTAKRVTLRNCFAKDSATSGFGFVVSACDVITLDDCHASGNYLDGIKILASTTNVNILGGSSNANGFGSAGDGLDGFAGAATFSIYGLTCDGNNGSGVQIKSGDLNKDQASIYGYIRNIQIHGLKCRNNSFTNNTGIGLYLTQSDQTDKAEPAMSMVNITGGVFEGNDSHGIYIACRNVVVMGPTCRNNGRNGITTSDRAMDVEIFGAMCSANGSLSITSAPFAPAYAGIGISGLRIKVWGGIFQGVDSDRVAVDTTAAWAPLTVYALNAVVTNGGNTYQCKQAGTSAGAGGPTGTDLVNTVTDGTCKWLYQPGNVALADLPVVQKYAVDVSSLANEVEIHNVNSRYHDVADYLSVNVDMTSGVCIQHGSGPFGGGAGVYGSVGSTWTRTNAAGEEVLWVKTSGNPNQPVTGWSRVYDIGRQLSRNNTDTLTGTIGLSSQRTILYPTGQPLTADRSVELPTSGGYDGAIWTVTRHAGDTGGPWNLNVKSGSGGATVKALAASQWGDFRYDGSNWILLRFGAL
jgi:hypothetical protein